MTTAEVGWANWPVNVVQGDEAVAKPKLFIGSSKTNVDVANELAEGLEEIAEVTVWEEDVFNLNDQTLDRLIKSASQYDFAVMIWAPDDITDSKGSSQASPRDNVIFECGLFMGVLGESHVFVVRDRCVDTKIPSDFTGKVLAEYDGARFGKDPKASVRSACSEIERAISENRPKELAGAWRQIYMESGDVEAATKENDIEVMAVADAISFIRRDSSGTEVLFQARGGLIDNRIRGDWRDNYKNCGGFLLFLTRQHDVMYGYNSDYGTCGGPVFRTWVMARKTGNPDATADKLALGITLIKERTVEFPENIKLVGA
jgi:predicted nucleotide-binding protein